MGCSSSKVNNDSNKDKNKSTHVYNELIKENNNDNNDSNATTYLLRNQNINSLQLSKQQTRECVSPSLSEIIYNYLINKDNHLLEQLGCLDNDVYSFISNDSLVLSIKKISYIYKNFDFRNDFNDEDIDLLGFYAYNSLDYVALEFACYFQGIVSLNINTEMKKENLIKVINKSKIRCLVVDNKTIEVINDILNDNNSIFPNLKAIMLINTNKITKKYNISTSNISLFTLYESISNVDNGKSKEFKLSESTSGIISIYYSIKDDVLYPITNYYICTQLDYYKKHIEINHTDVYFSYLSYANILEKITLIGFFINNSRIGLITNDIESNFKENIIKLKPTVLLTSPHVLNNINNSINLNFEKFSNTKTDFIHKSIGNKRTEIRKDKKITTSKFLESNIFQSIKDNLGGNLKLLISSFDILDKELAEDFLIYLSCPIVNIYFSNKLGIISSTLLDDYSYTSNGFLYDCNEIKLDKKNLYTSNNTNTNNELSNNTNNNTNKDLYSMIITNSINNMQLNNNDNDSIIKTNIMCELDIKKSSFLIVCNNNEYIAYNNTIFNLKKIENNLNRNLFIENCIVIKDNDNNNNDKHSISILIYLYKDACINELIKTKKINDTNAYEFNKDDYEYFNDRIIEYIEKNKVVGNILYQLKFSSVEFSISNEYLDLYSKKNRKYIEENYNSKIV